MTGILENYVLPVVCPKCGAQIQKTIGWFRENNEISCPCGTSNYLVTEELVRIIDELEGAIGRLMRPTPETQARRRVHQVPARDKPRRAYER
jgi:hypothetical protein